MHILPLAFIAASLAMLATTNVQAAQPACGTRPVAAAVGKAVRKDVIDRATRLAGQQAAEHVPPVVPRSAVSSVWNTLTSHMPHHSPSKSGTMTAAHDCR